MIDSEQFREAAEKSLELMIDAGMTMRELRKFAAAAALTKYRGNRTHSAIALGVCTRTMRKWINEFGLHYVHVDMTQHFKTGRLK